MKIGFIADKSGLISMAEQKRLLIAGDIPLDHIYTPDHGLDEAVKACDRGGDILVVYSVAVIGAIAYPRTVKALAACNASIFVLRKDLLIDCADGEAVADGLLDIREHNALGGKNAGRGLKFSQEEVTAILDYAEKNNQVQAAEKYNGLFDGKRLTTTDVSRMVNGSYFKETEQETNDIVAGQGI